MTEFGSSELELEPDPGELADIAYLAWEAEGAVTAGDIEEMAENAEMDVNVYQVSNGMDHLADQGLLDGKGMEYDVGESQQFIDPDPGTVERLLTPVIGGAFIEDPYRAFAAVHEAQESYRPEFQEQEEVENDYVAPRIGEAGSTEAVGSLDEEYVEGVDL